MNKYMSMALQEAQNAMNQNEIPIGCVLAHHNSNLIFKSYNTVEKNHNALQHAEINTIQQAIQATKQKYLTDFDIYITLEPCYMCAHAISLVKIPNIFFGAYNHQTGAISNQFNLYHHSIYKPNYFGGICELQCKKLLDIFFSKKRNQ